MAKLLLINGMSNRQGNNIGDVVCVVEDDHEFSQAEKDGFDIKTVKGTKAEVQKQLDDQLNVEVSKFTKAQLPKFPIRSYVDVTGTILSLNTNEIKETPLEKEPPVQIEIVMEEFLATEPMTIINNEGKIISEEPIT